MNEGLVLLNHSGEILSINNAAATLLSTDKKAVGKNMLTVIHVVKIQEMLKKSWIGESSESDIELHNRYYQFNVSPVLSDDNVSGAVGLMIDVTEKELGEQMRQEFSANVSHELKTHLHAISGYAELIKNEMV